jgi:hypothetical protein
MRSSGTVRNLTPDRKHGGHSGGRIVIGAPFPEEAKKTQASGTGGRSDAEIPGDEDEIEQRREG